MLAPALVGLLLASPLRLLFEATTTAGARPFGLERARAAGRVLEVARASFVGQSDPTFGLLRSVHMTSQTTHMRA